MKVCPSSQWLNHPAVVPMRRSIAAKLREHSGYFRHLGAVVFLCGGLGSERRDYLAAYLRSKSSANVFFAEDVWRLVSEHAPSGNALAMESRLASLADVVALIVESPGTFCELGAFALSDDLRPKLLLILDKSFENDESFIATGPVRWVDGDSAFAPAMWVDMGKILLHADEVVERLERVKSKGARGQIEVLGDPMIELVFLVDLATIFGPCTLDEIETLATDVFGRPAAKVEYALLLGLAVALELLRESNGLYLRPLQNGDIRPFHRPSKSLDVLEMRAAVMGVRQKVPGLEIIPQAVAVS